MCLMCLTSTISPSSVAVRDLVLSTWGNIPHCHQEILTKGKGTSIQAAYFLKPSCTNSILYQWFQCMVSSFKFLWLGGDNSLSHRHSWGFDPFFLPLELLNGWLARVITDKLWYYDAIVICPFRNCLRVTTVHLLNWVKWWGNAMSCLLKTTSNKNPRYNSVGIIILW